MPVNIKWDEAANVWVAINDELGIAMEDSSYDELISRLLVTIPEMCELNDISVPCISFITATRVVTCV